MRIVMLQRHTTVHGGGELVAAWITQALKDVHEVTVYSWDPPDWELRDRYYGTSLADGPVAFRRASPVLDAALTMAGSRFIDSVGFQRFALLMRLARRVVPDYDLAISPLDEFDCGTRMLQYVHYPWTPAAVGRPGADGEPRRRRPWMVLSGFSWRRVRENPMAVNSAHTARDVKELMGVQPEVILPPCPGRFPQVPWSERAELAVMVGRLVPEKRFDLGVEIVRRLRERGRDLRLLVLGNGFGVGRRDLREARRLLGAEPWVELHENLDRDELTALLASARYGIHAADHEPYGIAVAEMMRAGCIPVTRRGGGPPEITGPDERLRFESAEEGAARLEEIAGSPGLAAELRAQLRERASILEPQAFVERIREWVEDQAAAARP